MTELTAAEIGGIGLFSYFVIKELFALVRSLINKKDSKSGDDFERILKALDEMVQHWRQVAKQVDNTSRKTDALYDWHNVKDAKGLPIWYSDSQTNEELKEIKAAFSIQGRLLNSIHDKQMYFEREIKK